MKISPEQQCITQAAKAKARIAQCRLAEFKKEGRSFESPLAGFAWEIDWKENPAERRKQILLLPVAFIVVMLLVAMTPLVYAIHLYEVWQQKHELRKTIKANSTLNDIQLPTTKTLESLWRLHGLHDCSRDEQVDLLNEWIENLYGKEITPRFDLHAKLEAIVEKQLNANAPYFKGESDLRLFFGSPTNTLVSLLSEELPSYESFAQSGRK